MSTEAQGEKKTRAVRIKKGPPHSPIFDGAYYEHDRPQHVAIAIGHSQGVTFAAGNRSRNVVLRTPYSYVGVCTYTVCSYAVHFGPAVSMRSRRLTVSRVSRSLSLTLDELDFPHPTESATENSFLFRQQQVTQRHKCQTCQIQDCCKIIPLCGRNATQH